MTTPTTVEQPIKSYQTNLRESRNLKLLEKINNMRQNDSFKDLQPNMQVCKSAIIDAIRSESFKDPRWKTWLKAMKHLQREFGH